MMMTIAITICRLFSRRDREREREREKERGRECGREGTHNTYPCLLFHMVLLYLFENFRTPATLSIYIETNNQ